MILPAAMPSGPRLWISAVLLQAGVSGLFATLLLRGPLAWVFALTIVAGFTAFAWQVVWMLRRLCPRPPGLPRADPAMMHAGAAFASLGIASVLGLWLAMAEESSATLRVAMAYGVFGLVGFLAQVIVGMEGRLLLAGGLAFDAVPFVRAGAWCLLAAAILDAVNVVRILRNAFVAPP